MAHSLTAFFPALETLASKYLVTGQGPRPTPQEAAQLPAKFDELKQDLFEQLLLFDQLAVKVRGENVPLILLTRFFGVRGIQQVIDQDALRFVQWKPVIVHPVTHLKGVDALGYGQMGSPVYDDPEQSVDLAFNWLSEPLSTRDRKIIKRKVVPLYEHASAEVAESAAGLIKAAYLSGRLAPFDLPPDHPYGDIPLAKREALNKCATEIAEYSYLLAHDMSSFSNYTYFMLLTETAQRLTSVAEVAKDFAQLATIEAFPDLKSVFLRLNNPFEHAIKLRAKGRSRRFRRWLASTSGGDADLAAEYTAAIADAKGLLDSAGGKITKAIAMTALKSAAGAAVGGISWGALAGLASSPLVDPALETGIDLLDQFVLDGLLKGWSPRLFFNDLRALKDSAQPTKG